MKKHFIYSRMIERHPNPLGVRFISGEAEIVIEHTEEGLHRVLGERRENPRDVDSLMTIETMIRSLLTT